MSMYIMDVRKKENVVNGGNPQIILPDFHQHSDL